MVVIMPYPVDYFQACGGTSLCRAKCNGTWADFEASLSGAAPSTQTSTVYVESLFFPTLSADRLNPMTIWALLEPPGSICVRVCGGTSGGVVNSCVAVAGTKDGQVVVQYYCTPTLLTATSTAPWTPRSSGSSRAATRGPTWWRWSARAR